MKEKDKKMIFSSIGRQIKSDSFVYESGIKSGRIDDDRSPKIHTFLFSFVGYLIFDWFLPLHVYFWVHYRFPVSFKLLFLFFLPLESTYDESSFLFAASLFLRI